MRAQFIPVLLLLSHLAGCAATPAPVSSGAMTSPTPALPGVAPSPVPLPVAQTVSGIDVSKFQGAFDFDSIKGSEYRYVFVKASEGITYQDADYAANISKARKAGLAVGSYHYYHSDDDATAQFANFSKTAVVLPNDLPPVVDIEELDENSAGDLHTELQRFLDLLEKSYGVKPIIYSGSGFANKYLNAFGSYPLWIAEYSVDAPKIPAGWASWMFWQYSEDCKIAGVEPALDCNRFNGSQVQLNNILIK